MEWRFSSVACTFPALILAVGLWLFLLGTEWPPLPRTPPPSGPPPPHTPSSHRPVWIGEQRGLYWVGPSGLLTKENYKGMKASVSLPGWASLSPCVLRCPEWPPGLWASVALVGTASTGESHCFSENPSFPSTRMDRLPLPLPLQTHSCHHLFPPALCSTVLWDLAPPPRRVFSTSPVVVAIHSRCCLNFIAGVCLPRHNAVMLFLPRFISDGIQTWQEVTHMPTLYPELVWPEILNVISELEIL